MGIRTIPFIFLVKQEESKSFDVFFGCFCVWKRGKRVEKYQAKSKTWKNVVPSGSDGCLGLFIAPGQTSRRQPFKGRQPPTSSNQVDLDTLGKVLTSYF